VNCCIIEGKGLQTMTLKKSYSQCLADGINHNTVWTRHSITISYLHVARPKLIFRSRSCQSPPRYLLRFSWVPPGIFRDSTSTRSRQFSSKSYIVHYSPPTVLPSDAVRSEIRRECSVGIATGWTTTVSFLAGARNDCSRAHPAFLSNGNSGGKAIGTWSWLLSI
jgi:hypothetical protein